MFFERVKITFRIFMQLESLMYTDLKFVFRSQLTSVLFIQVFLSFLLFQFQIQKLYLQT